MKGLRRRAAVVGAMAAVGIVLGGLSPAWADWPFRDDGTSYQCNQKPPVLFSPVDGSPIVHADEDSTVDPFNPSLRLCVATRYAGSHTVAADAYSNSGVAPGNFQVVRVCVGTEVTPGCTSTTTGYAVGAPDAGDAGAKPCVGAAVITPCQSVGVTPASPPSFVSVGSNPSAPCPFGVCVTPSVMVQTGPPVATAYVGATPVQVGAPAVCASVNRPSTFIDVEPGSDC